MGKIKQVNVLEFLKKKQMRQFSLPELELPEQMKFIRKSPVSSPSSSPGQVKRNISFGLEIHTEKKKLRLGSKNLIFNQNFPGDSDIEFLLPFHY